MMASCRTCLLPLMLAAVFLWSNTETRGQKTGGWERFMIEGENRLVQSELDEAAKYFQVASDFAAREENTDGVIRAGFGFLAAQQPEAALESWVKARDIAGNKRDWRGILRVADCMLHLRKGKEAAETLRMARDAASEQDKPMADVLAARALIVLRSEGEASELTNLAAEVFTSKDRSWKGVYRTAQNFAQLFDDERSDEFFTLAEQLAGESEDVNTYPRYKADTLLVQGWGTIEPGLASELEMDQPQADAQAKTLKLSVVEDQKCIGGKRIDAALVVKSLHNQLENLNRIGVNVRSENESVVVFELERNVNLQYFRFRLTDPGLGIRCPR